MPQFNPEFWVPQLFWLAVIATILFLVMWKITLPRVDVVIADRQDRIGGNLQKALLARELAMQPKLLVAAQPTRGIDIGATEFVHRQLLDLRAKGGGVLLISEDLEELFALSDRIAVLYAGRVMAALPIAQATVERVGLLMAGVEESP